MERWIHAPHARNRNRNETVRKGRRERSTLKKGNQIKYWNSAAPGDHKNKRLKAMHILVHVLEMSNDTKTFKLETSAEFMGESKSFT
jgi:hypothetical protein